MKMCSENGCVHWAGGGVMEIVDPPHFTNPDQTKRAPKKLFWCEYHEQSVRNRINFPYEDIPPEELI